MGDIYVRKTPMTAGSLSYSSDALTFDEYLPIHALSVMLSK